MFADAAGENVGDEQVIQIVVVFAEAEDDVTAVFELVDDRLDGISTGAFDDIRFVGDLFETAVQRFGRFLVDIASPRPVSDGVGGGHAFARLGVGNGRAGVEGDELLEPIAAEITNESAEGYASGVGEIELGGDEFDIGRGEIAHGQL